MKRIVLTILSVLILTSMAASSVFATGVVNVTATPTFIAIDNTPTTYDFATVAASVTLSTGTGTFTVANTSSVAINLAIVTDAAWTGGGGWVTSSTGVPGSGIAGMYAGVTGTTYDKLLSATSVELKHELAASTSQTWGFRLLTPTSFTDGVQKATTVTVSAAAHS